MLSFGVSRGKTGKKVGAGFAGKRVDSGVSVTQSAIIGERGACSHFKPLDLYLGSAPQTHPSGLSRDLRASPPSLKLRRTSWEHVTSRCNVASSPGASQQAGALPPRMFPRGIPSAALHTKQQVPVGGRSRASPIHGSLSLAFSARNMPPASRAAVPAYPRFRSAPPPPASPPPPPQRCKWGKWGQALHFDI